MSSAFYTADPAKQKKVESNKEESEENVMGWVLVSLTKPL